MLQLETISEQLLLTVDEAAPMLGFTAQALAARIRRKQWTVGVKSLASPPGCLSPQSVRGLRARSPTPLLSQKLNRVLQRTRLNGRVPLGHRRGGVTEDLPDDVRADAFRCQVRTDRMPQLVDGNPADSRGVASSVKR